MLTVPVPQSKSAEQGWECWEGQLQSHGWDKLIPSGQSLQAGTARVSWGGLSCPESLPGLTTSSGWTGRCRNMGRDPWVPQSSPLLLSLGV